MPFLLTFIEQKLRRENFIYYFAFRSKTRGELICFAWFIFEAKKSLKQTRCIPTKSSCSTNKTTGCGRAKRVNISKMSSFYWSIDSFILNDQKTWLFSLHQVLLWYKQRIPIWNTPTTTFTLSIILFLVRSWIFVSWDSNGCFSLYLW